MMLEVLFLILAVPAGFLIAWLANDELVSGRRWFYALLLLSIGLGGWFFLTGLSYLGLTFSFMAIVSFISILKSRDKKWLRIKH